MTVQEAVSDILRARPYLEEAIGDGLINLSSLARSLAGEVAARTGKDAHRGAIVMAIQRHRPGRLTSVRISSRNLLSNVTNIIVRSEIAAFTFVNSASLPARLTQLSMALSRKKGMFYSFSQGVFETTIILYRGGVEDLMDILVKESEVARTENLACITLYLPVEYTQIAGYYYYILKMIAWEGINIIEILSTTNEFAIILSEADVDRAFSTLQRARKR